MDAGHGTERERIYRLEVEGRWSERSSAWFEAERVRTVGANTVIEVRVADQAELFGRLRRLHDLNLRLVAVTRVDSTHPDTTEEE